MIKDGSANLFVCGVSRPEVRWCSAGNAWDASERRRTKLLVLCHQKARPGPQVLKEPVELPVHLVVLWDFPRSLLDVLHHVDDLAQDSVESGDGIVRWWRVGRRTGPFHEQTRGLGDWSLRASFKDTGCWSRFTELSGDFAQNWCDPEDRRAICGFFSQPEIRKLVKSQYARGALKPQCCELRTHRPPGGPSHGVRALPARPALVPVGVLRPGATRPPMRPSSDRLP